MLSEKYKEALLYAMNLHKDQIRKGSNIPYFTHLMSVSSLVIENGGTEVEAIAALLHDAVEDQGGMQTANEIKEKFGDEVFEIVLGCSDSTVENKNEKQEWMERKQNYRNHLEKASESVKLVSAADKLHNIRSIYHDLKLVGPDVWNRFGASRIDILSNYRKLAKIYTENSNRNSVNNIGYEIFNVISNIEFLFRIHFFPI